MLKDPFAGPFLFVFFIILYYTHWGILALITIIGSKFRLFSIRRERD